MTQQQSITATTAASPTDTHQVTSTVPGPEKLVIDLDGRMVRRLGVPVHLTRTEWTLLEYLVRNVGIVLTHQMLLRHVWGDAYETEINYVHTYIRRLRHKLEDAPRQPTYILTEPGLGYRWNGVPHNNAQIPRNQLAHSSSQTQRRPIYHTSFIGRDEEIKQVIDLIQHRKKRLITLSGAPGVGKTRLALHVADIIAASFAHGRIFIDLSVLHDATHVVSTLARTLGLDDQEGVAPLEQIQAWFAETTCVLVLDNFEHVLSAAPNVIELLAAPHLYVLVTSRAALRLSVEHEVRIQPLALLSPGTPSSLATYTEASSIALFLDRASVAYPAFQLTDENAPTIAEICRHLDGVPLAIELAAARMALLSPAAMLARLARRFSVLTTDMRDGPMRHQSLRTALAWSYDLLPRESQQLFAQLSVFVDGWTVEAVEAVVQLPGMQMSSINGDETVILNGIRLLVTNNLVVSLPHAGEEPRFTMMVTIREFAAEQLADDTERAGVQQRHVQYYLALVEMGAAGLNGSQQKFWIERLEREHNNIRTALHWVIETQETELAFRYVGALWMFWLIRGYVQEGVDWIAQTLSLPAIEHDSLRAGALQGAGALAHSRGQYQQAHEFFSDCLRIRQHLRDQDGIARALNNMGTVALVQQQYAHAHRLFKESLEIQRGLDQPYFIAGVLNNLSIVAMRQHEYAYARRCLEESLALRQQAGDILGATMALVNLADIDMEEGEYRNAASLLRRAVVLAHQLRDVRNIILCVIDLAGIAGLCQQPTRAAQLYGAADMLNKQSGFVVQAHDRDEYERQRVAAERQLSPEVWQTAWRTGQAMELEAIVEYALQDVV